MAFPSWAIAIVILFIIVLVSTIVYVVLRKRIGRKRGAVGAQLDECSLEKSISTHHSPSSSTYPAIKPLMPYNYTDKNEASRTLKGSQASSNHELNNNSSSTVSVSPYTCISNRSVDEKMDTTQQPSEQKNVSPNATAVQLSNPVKEDSSSSVWTDDAHGYSKEGSFKINLPLPPPSTSFFSDKMELDSIEANNLYQSYMNVSQQDYVSIELDDKPFLSSAAANIQQKAATLRSTLRQSLRRKTTTNKSNGAPLSQFFDNMSHNTTSSSSIRSPAKSSSSECGTTCISRQSSTTSSRFPRPSLQAPSTPSLPLPPSPRPDSPMDYFSKSNSSSKKSLIRHQAEEEESNSSNKIMIDTIPPESYFSLPMSPATPSPFKPASTPVNPSSEVIIPNYASVVDEITHHSNYRSINDADSEISKDEEETRLTDKSTTPQEAASAAHKIIRSASRKSRTRSMIITDEAAQAMFTSFANNGDTVPLTPAAATVAKYATVRGMNRMDDDTIRPSPLDIKKWSVSSSNDPSSSSPSTTSSPKRAITNSIVSGSAIVSGRKMQQGSSGNNLLASGRRNDLKSATLGRKPTNSTQGPKSLRNLFARPDDSSSEKSLVVDQQKATLSPSARSSLTIITTRQSTDTDVVPSSPIATIAESTSPYSSKNNTLRNKMGSNVDTIRRMLQSSWSGNNLKESGSSHSLASSSGDMTTGSVGSSFRPVASPLGSINPRLQNQHLVSLSLKAQQHQQTRSRPSMPIGFMEEGPAPTASFSSSTVRTMIPAEEEEQEQQQLLLLQQSRSRMQEKKPSVETGLLGSRQNNNNNNRLQSSKVGGNGFNNKKQPQGKTPAQKEREKYLKSIERQ